MNRLNYLFHVRERVRVFAEEAENIIDKGDTRVTHTRLYITLNVEVGLGPKEISGIFTLLLNKIIIN